MPTDARARARVAKIADRLGLQGDPVRSGHGWSNQVWMYDDVVVRLASRPGPGPLLAELEIASRLPAATGYPRVLDSGEIDGYPWMAQQRIPGDNLAGVWPALRGDQRARAVADLWHRLSVVPRADLTGVTLPATPLYAFDPTQFAGQLAAARPLVGDAIVRRAADLVRAGLDAISRHPMGLVHTDAVLTNVVWTGSAAIPIDFEFACVGPVDLDVDCVGREVVQRQDAAAISALQAALEPTLRAPGAIHRLRTYSVLRDLWAIGKWIENDPTLDGATSWAPVRALVDDVRGSGWLDELLAVTS